MFKSFGLETGQPVAGSPSPTLARETTGLHQKWSSSHCEPTPFYVGVMSDAATLTWSSEDEGSCAAGDEFGNRRFCPEPAMDNTAPHGFCFQSKTTALHAFGESSCHLSNPGT